ncbi:MAG: cell division protein ZapA [Alphaproteobacteria bacterium]
MSEVTLKINKRGYSLSCDEGQEGRLTDLAHYVDGRLQDIAASGAATNESHLLVLTSLVLADEVYELRDEVGKMNDYIRQVQDGRSMPVQNGISSEDEQMIVEAIEYLAHKIESIAKRVQGSDEVKAA